MHIAPEIKSIFFIAKLVYIVSNYVQCQLRKGLQFEQERSRRTCARPYLPNTSYVQELTCGLSTPSGSLSESYIYAQFI